MNLYESLSGSWKRFRDWISKRFRQEPDKGPPRAAEQTWRVVKAFTVSKELSDSVKGNEDVSHEDEVKSIFAVADGASSSFDARAWADVVISGYASDPSGFDANCVASLAMEFDKKYVYDSMTGPQQTAYEKGSHATLMGIQASGSRLMITYTGDSLFVVLDDLTVKCTLPFKDESEFPLAPDLLTCRLGAIQPKINRLDIDVAEYVSPAVLLMTDAIGQWFLRNHKADLQPAAQLKAISSDREFEEFVERHRRDNTLKPDDSTFLWIERVYV